MPIQESSACQALNAFENLASIVEAENFEIWPQILIVLLGVDVFIHFPHYFLCRPFTFCPSLSCERNGHMSPFGAHILPGGLGRHCTLVAAHLSLLSAWCWSIRQILASPPPTYCSSSLHRPGDGQLGPCLHVPGWSLLVKGPSRVCALGSALLARGVAAGRSGWEPLRRPPPPAWAQRSPTLFRPTFSHPAAKPIQRGRVSQLCSVGFFQHRGARLESYPKMILLLWWKTGCPRCASWCEVETQI